MALGVDGVRVGTWTAPSGGSGCTVVLPPAGTLGAVAVRGSAPGTREAAALGVHGKLTVCHGVVLAGGSAFGLAAADGVVRWLEAAGVGYPVAGAHVPIVGAAIVLDRAVLDPPSRPDADAGAAACGAASADDPPEGGFGVGAGCTIAKVGGLDRGWRGGQGIAVHRGGGVTVGALVANNAVGELVGEDGTWLARARIDDDAPRFPFVPPPGVAPAAPGGGGPTRAAPDGGPTSNTVIGVIVTDARLDKRDAHRVADLGHSGVARAVRPAHTEADGDALFCLATGQVEASLDLVAHLAAEAVAEAVRRGPLTAVGRDGLPGLADGV
ncbi:P1 family peptidase [Nitriliruptor alkaliphilus]|uniref:P1 family peptidase n=1 Tax=Nitriliruptor alkaliphilus TaxID=427918 RepID=UPI000695FD82|nr:P1 family peptidase [Nitriliruptor alkaliphilus]